METKHLQFERCGIKFAETEGRFSGYGSVFGVEDDHQDIIMPGAFSDAIKSGNDVHVYVNHGWLRGELPVGKWAALAEDQFGLAGDADLQMKMPSAANAYWAVKGNLVSGLSIGYIVDRAGIEPKSGGGRVIHRIKTLKEISIVTDPSNKAAQITDVKSAMLDEVAEIKSIRDFESFLRDAGGLSKGAALALTARARDLFGRGEHAPDEVQAKMAEVAARLQRLAA